ncbi:hypothetical protein JOC93_002586 [Priestia taiwanensis]|uniref:Uncharacterized protein n=1 Tax=Priestia taiwanensis TaxID=1347902 RepID=A0A917ARG9_9BACI|nr:hypothetical protein [Priestia taiwanensis]GGE70269.1 hypothetical protein GCM10007140_20240 [Priestia taiwanensis]
MKLEEIREKYGNRKYVAASINTVGFLLYVFLETSSFLYLALILMVAYELVSHKLSQNLVLRCFFYIVLGVTTIYVLENYIFVKS